MTTVTETVDIEAPTERVFSYVDDMRNVGWHMTDALLSRFGRCSETRSVCLSCARTRMRWSIGRDAARNQPRRRER
jgi:hypothetical protein